MNQSKPRKFSIARIIIIIFLVVSGVTVAASLSILAGLPRLFLPPAKPVLITPPEKIDVSVRNAVCNAANKVILEDPETYEPEYPEVFVCDGNYFLLSRGVNHTGKRYIFNYSGITEGWFEMGFGHYLGKCDGLGCNFSRPCSSADVCSGIELNCSGDQCQYINAHRFNEPSRCLNIQNKQWLNGCLSGLAYTNHDEKICAEIPPNQPYPYSRRQYDCYKGVGKDIGSFYMANAEGCSKLSPMSIQPCLEGYENYHNNNPIILSDWKYCLGAENKEMRNICLTDMAATSGDESICEKINDSDSQGYHQESCYNAAGWMFARKVKSENECTAMRNEQARKKCIEQYRELHGN